MQQAIGEAAMEKYLRHDSASPAMLNLKSQLYELRGHYEESLAIADSMLKRDPESVLAFSNKACDLLKLGRPQEALAAVNVILDRGSGWEVDALAAAVHYALAQYEPAAQFARKATAQMDQDDLSNPRYGAVRLTLAAAEARLGLLPRARAVLADFNAAVPAQTVSAIKKWMSPAADLAGYEPLYDGLRLAGVAD